MSAKATTWAWSLPMLSGTEKLVLLAMADIANDAHDNEVWCSQNHLADKTGLSTRTVGRTLTKLREQAVIEERQARYYLAADGKQYPTLCHHLTMSPPLRQEVRSRQSVVSGPDTVSDQVPTECRTNYNSNSNITDRAPRTRKPGEFAEVAVFFLDNESDSNQAELFFNHFENNGWKQGGKAPMKDWTLAARNWIAREGEYSGRR